MRTIETATDPDMDAIIEMLMTGKPVPTEICDRLREEGNKITERIRQEVGETNIAIDLIRESRDE